MPEVDPRHQDQAGQVLSWPTRARLRTYLLLSLLLDVLFVPIYGGSNHLNGLRDFHFHWYADWELALPLVPDMIYVYLSLWGLFLLPLFTLQTGELRQMGKQMAFAIVFSGLFFFLLPTHAGFTPQPELTNGHPGFTLVYFMDEPYNLFPSLHISLSSLIVVAIIGRGGLLWRSALAAWWVLLTLSVLLTHQHHVLDIVGGLAVCALAVRLFPLSASVSVRG